MTKRTNRRPSHRPSGRVLARPGAAQLAVASAASDRLERDGLIGQMRLANERLVLVTLRADAAVVEANAARAAAAELAALEGDRRRLAEDLAARLVASERARSETESQFQTLANTIPMLAWFANADGEIAWYNQRWYDYTGVAFAGQTGSWLAIHESEDAPRISARWRESVASGQPWEDTFRLRRHDGVFRWFLSRALPLCDASGAIVRWFGMNVDVDDQKRAEERAIANGRAKDEFLAMLGHELRGPLAPILLALEVIARRNAGAFPRERGIIERQVTHLVRLVDDLLDVSRIAGGKVELHLERVELAELVARAIELVTPLVEQKQHALQVDVASRGLEIDADPTRLVQAIGNLLANATKYTPAGGLIQISGMRVDGSVELRISDNGIGIGPEMLPRVFDLFAQAPQALDRASGGLGLGLAIVKSLVVLHRGTVAVTSAGAGLGSEFVLSLPAARDRAPSPPASASPLVPARTRGRRILVVDDSQEIAALMLDVLTSLGHTVRVASDGISALAIARDFRPEIALLDIGLPGMDGCELAGKLRALLPADSISLIAITGYGQAAERQRSAAAGFHLHLVKPVDVAKLEASLDAVSASRNPESPDVA